MIFGWQIEFGFWKSVTSLDMKPEVVLRNQGAILKLDKTSYLRRWWSDVDEIWPAGRFWNTYPVPCNSYINVIQLQI